MKTARECAMERARALPEEAPAPAAELLAPSPRYVKPPRWAYVVTAVWIAVRWPFRILGAILRGIEAGLRIFDAILKTMFRVAWSIFWVLAWIALIIVGIALAFVYPVGAAIVGAIAFLVWLISRVNVLARSAQQRGQWAEAQRRFHQYDRYGS